MRYIIFFFGNFWHWLGALIFLVVIVDGFFLNLFRIINNAIIRKRKIPERNIEEFPANAPNGVIWPFNGKMYIRIDGTWYELGDNIKNHETDQQAV